MTASQSSSKNYIWSSSDVLGKGTYGAVYKARNRYSGELFAVKTFNSNIVIPEDLQKREFDVLSQLNHANIVKFLAVEHETAVKSGSKQSLVLVMELCTGGSLQGLLQQPENYFGLEEREFLCVLDHVACGMKHLREKNITHRDIKPGNIMRSIDDSGRSIYKLVDFGSARNLNPGDKFQSIVGTREYLHPDMYMRYAKRSPKHCGASVDLWSIGVTLYHVATGQTPFKPCQERFDESMLQIYEKKPFGCIAGVQERLHGDIQYSSDFPKSCSLSRGLKEQILPMIAGLCETNDEKMMDFDEFFKSAKAIVDKKVVYVFNCNKAEVLHIYSDESERLAEFQTHIEKQSDILTKDQLLLFENQNFLKITKSTQSVFEYPKTSPTNPIYLFSVPTESVDNTIFIPDEIINSIDPQKLSTAQLADDVQFANAYCTGVQYACKLIKQLHLKQELIWKAAKVYIRHLVQEVSQAKDLIIETEFHVQESGKQIELVDQNVQVMMSLIETLSKEKKKKYNLTIILRMEAITRQKDCFGKVSEQVADLKLATENLFRQIDIERESCQDGIGCNEEDCCIRKSEKLVDSVLPVRTGFEKEKPTTNNQKEIRRFEKAQLKANCTNAFSLLQEHCHSNTNTVFNIFSQWYRRMFDIQRQLQVMQNKIEAVIEKQLLIADNLDQAQDERQHRLNQLLTDIGSQAPQSKDLRSRVDSTTNNDFSFVVPHASRTRARDSIKECYKTLKEISK